MNKNNNPLKKEDFDVLFYEQRRLTRDEPCDYAIGNGIISSIQFKEHTTTCDKALCHECATRLWTDCDVCPEHAEELRVILRR